MQAFNKNFKEIIINFTFNHLVSNFVMFIHYLTFIFKHTEIYGCA